MSRRSKREVRKRTYTEESDDSGSEGEWVPSKSDSDSNFEENDSQPKAVKPKAVAEPDLKDQENEQSSDGPLVPLSKPKRRRKKIFVIDKEEEEKPTYTRKTDRGGYSHTNLSKMRISKANTGNKPWNFGKRRSSADKAKIAAGVRARNRTLLLQKLKRLGMTEEEYNNKKKEIKYLRERIRRAKKANGKHGDKKLDKKLQDAIDATTEKKGVEINIKKEDQSKEEQKEEQEKPKEEQKEGAPTIAEKSQRNLGIFSKEITWRPLSSENQSCPTGGPGGLICCDSCSTQFNLMLTKLSEDVETHRMMKESGEVSEILEFLNQKKDILKNAVNAARTKVPPLPPPGTSRLNPYPESRTPSSWKSGAFSSKSENPENNLRAWNLTSAVDIGAIGGFASV